jgi:hypothetical protein
MGKAIHDALGTFGMFDRQWVYYSLISVIGCMECQRDPPTLLCSPTQNLSMDGFIGRPLGASFVFDFAEK